MPPGDVDSTIQQGPRGPSTPQELALGNIALSQSEQALNAIRTAGQDPRQLALTIEDRIGEQQAKMAAAQERLKFLDEHFARYGTGPNFTDNEAHVATARQQLENAQSSLLDLRAQQTLLPEQIKQFEGTQRIANLTASRLEDFISGKDIIGVSPEERALLTQGISGISQDVATSRGLNRTDVPVMQAVAPSVSQALLAQMNANRSLFTGINQFQQGMGLSNRQLQMGLAGQNPAASLTGVYAGLAPGGQNQSGSRGLGGADVMSMFGQGAMGAGLGLYGLGASGLLGTKTALGGAALGAASTCWIAEAIYGTNAPETGVIRWWLNVHFAKQPVGRVVMALYSKYGRWIAEYVQRWAWLRQVLRPIFDLALRRGLATG